MNVRRYGRRCARRYARMNVRRCARRNVGRYSRRKARRTLEDTSERIALLSGLLCIICSAYVRIRAGALTSKARRNERSKNKERNKESLLTTYGSNYQVGQIERRAPDHSGDEEEGFPFLSVLAGFYRKEIQNIYDIYVTI